MDTVLWQKNLDAFRSLWTETPEILREVHEHESYHIRDTVILVFTTKLLIFKANEDDDTISVEARNNVRFRPPAGFQKKTTGVWQQFIGRRFDWGWVTISQQGYCDGVLMSFDDISPAVSFEVIASSIEISSMVRQEELTSAKPKPRRQRSKKPARAKKPVRRRR